MTTPSGPIQVTITEAESPSVQITRTPPAGISISSGGPRGEQGIQGPTGAPGPQNLTIVPVGTPLPTDPDELAALEGTLWVEYTP